MTMEVNTIGPHQGVFASGNNMASTMTYYYGQLGLAPPTIRTHKRDKSAHVHFSTSTQLPHSTQGVFGVGQTMSEEYNWIQGFLLHTQIRVQSHSLSEENVTFTQPIQSMEKTSKQLQNIIPNNHHSTYRHRKHTRNRARAIAAKALEEALFNATSKHKIDSEVDQPQYDQTSNHGSKKKVNSSNPPQMHQETDSCASNTIHPNRVQAVSPVSAANLTVTSFNNHVPSHLNLGNDSHRRLPKPRKPLLDPFDAAEYLHRADTKKQDALKARQDLLNSTLDTSQNPIENEILDADLCRHCLVHHGIRHRRSDHYSPLKSKGLKGLLDQTLGSPSRSQRQQSAFTHSDRPIPPKLTVANDQANISSSIGDSFNVPENTVKGDNNHIRTHRQSNTNPSKENTQTMDHTVNKSSSRPTFTNSASASDIQTTSTNHTFSNTNLGKAQGHNSTVNSTVSRPVYMEYSPPSNKNTENIQQEKNQKIVSQHNGSGRSQSLSGAYEKHLKASQTVRERSASPSMRHTNKLGTATLAAGTLTATELLRRSGEDMLNESKPRRTDPSRDSTRSDGFLRKRRGMTSGTLISTMH